MEGSPIQPSGDNQKWRWSADLRNTSRRAAVGVHRSSRLFEEIGDNRGSLSADLGINLCELSAAVRSLKAVTQRNRVVPVADGFLGGFVRVDGFKLGKRNGHPPPLPTDLHKDALKRARCRETYENTPQARTQPGLNLKPVSRACAKAIPSWCGGLIGSEEIWPTWSA